MAKGWCDTCVWEELVWTADKRDRIWEPTIYTHETLKIITLELKLSINNTVAICAKNTFNYQNSCRNTFGWPVNLRIAINGTG